MDEKIIDLDGSDAVKLLRRIARRWIEERGLEAFTVFESAQKDSGLLALEEFRWLDSGAEEAGETLIESSKIALDAILDGDDQEVKAWLVAELKKHEAGQAHAFDPITAAILGATLIGIILAARVKKIGNTEFYEGLPKEAADFARVAAGVPLPGKG